MNLARGFAWVLLAAPLAAAAAESVTLDRLPADISPHDLVSLQRGAQAYVNYCMGCHSAAYMRYNRLQDLGLTPQQIRDNLIFTGAKVGDLMTIAMPARESKEWFGAPPPDLTLIARSRSSGAGSGADWLYSYLRGFYRDSSRPTGWNNTVYPNVAMPHVLWQLQGEQALSTEVVSIPRGTKGEVEKHEVQKLVLEKPGTMSPAEYDRMVGDLVNFLVYVAEPSRQSRVELGIYVLMFLGLLFVFAYLLKNEYWKDVH
ncbi:MAG TPA: cytochrome c1 [Burkholderiales bacterium]|nr:cytochrome c1 [Burkholderiales bacterium]